MQTKLTLRMDEDIIKQAKSAAREMGKSLSEMVEDFFAVLTRVRGKRSRGELTPTVRALKGCLRGATVDETDYCKHLEEKYR
ncbi:MAG: antitoxin [Candidatus Riflebacteria bacterium]|nr:antitoxin [Candidatus Riflebacteria bacterium]